MKTKLVRVHFGLRPLPLGVPGGFGSKGRYKGGLKGGLCLTPFGSQNTHPRRPTPQKAHTPEAHGRGRLWPNRLWSMLCVCVFVCVFVWRGCWTVSWCGVSRVGVGFKVLVWSCSVLPGPPFPGDRPSQDRPSLGPPFLRTVVPGTALPGPSFPWTAKNFALKPRRPRSRRGFTRQPENSKRAHLSAPALQTPPKFHEKTPREGRKERTNFAAGEGKKKREIMGPPPLRAGWAPTLRTPTSWSMGPPSQPTHDNSTHTGKT